MPDIPLQVIVDSAHLKNLSAVAERLRAAGMKVEQTLETIGVLIGSADAAKISALARVEGVAEVEPQQTYQLPPLEGPNP
jgi:hypothetical protein